MKTQADLGRDRIPFLVLKLAGPAMIAQFVNVLYSIIDRMYIGHIPGDGALALAGAGICGPIVTLLSSFGTLVGLGGSILLSIRLGEKNYQKARQILANSFFMLCVFSAVLTVLFLLIKDRLLWWFGASAVTFSYADTYLTIYTFGTFFALMALGLNYFISCQGFPLYGMATVLIGAAANIILDPIFIFLLNMGVAGAAVATVISQMLSCGFALRFLFGKRPPVRITFGGYDRKLMGRILFLGVSPFLILATDSVIQIVMNTSLQTFGGPTQGDMLITCATIVQSYMQLITSPMLGISGGTQSLISYNYGACQTQRVKSAERWILLLMLSFTTLMFFVSRLLPRFFVLFFTTDPGYMKFSIWGIRVFTLMIIPLSFQYVLVDGLTAMERPKTALALSLFRKTLFTALVVLLPIVFAARDAFYAEPLSDGIAAFVSTVVFLLVADRHLKKREEVAAPKA